MVSVCLPLSGAAQAPLQMTRRTPCILARGEFHLETNLIRAWSKLEKIVWVEWKLNSLVSWFTSDAIYCSNPNPKSGDLVAAICFLCQPQMPGLAELCCSTHMLLSLVASELSEGWCQRTTQWCQWSHVGCFTHCRVAWKKKSESIKEKDHWIWGNNYQIVFFSS